MINSSSASSSETSRKDFTFFDIRNSPSITHFFVLSSRDDESALSPRSKPKAPIKTDFPAPVSPVIMFNPLPNCN